MGRGQLNVKRSCVVRHLSADQLVDLLEVPRETARSLDRPEFMDASALVYDDLSYREEEDVHRQIQAKVSSDTQRVGAEERSDIWESGWKENLVLYAEDPSWSALQPRYYTKGKSVVSKFTGFPVYRVAGKFVQSPRIDFEIHMAEAHRLLLFEYVRQVMGDKTPPLILDVGCGPGLNLIALNRCFPSSALIAADFVSSATSCTASVMAERASEFRFQHFDLRNPPMDLKLPSGSLVVTVGALEQVGYADGLSFFKRWIEQQEGVWFCHSEPFTEMYSKETPLDVFMIEFAQKRRYTTGFLPWLRKKSSEGGIRDFEEHRVRLGSVMLEGYNWCLYRVS